MRFLDRLLLRDVLRIAMTGEPAFYGVKSLGARFAERLLSGVRPEARARKLDFGQLRSARDIRGNAYRAAERAIDGLPGAQWADSLTPALGIDGGLLVRKFLFDEDYLQFEFLEMALRYAEEHPREAHQLSADLARAGDLAARLGQRLALIPRTGTGGAGALAVFLLPVFIEYFWHRRGVDDGLRLDQKVVCEVDGEKTLEMFSSLFSDLPKDKLAFVAEQRNAHAFEDARKVGPLGLRRDGLRFLRLAAWRYIGGCLRHWSAASVLGNRLFRIFYVFMQGRAEAVDGTGNAYFTYEHYVTVKAVRNEFLRAAGNRTVFVPMNAHVTPQFFHSEILLNYDVMCAAGPHTEALYRRKRTRTRHFPPTGSYDSHRGATRLAGRAERLARLRDFKGASIAVTIVSPGIADATVNVETRLMALARALAALGGVKVFVRLKPVPPAARFAGFYAEQAAGCKGMLLTEGEFELFDFPEVTDLFVTSVSNAAFDLAQAGAPVMFIDSFDDPDLLLCLAEARGMLLPEAGALEAIREWIEDRAGARLRWRETMAAFASSITYRHRDFQAYRHNFLDRVGGMPLPGSLLAQMGEAA